jgi:hypothetical protein
VPRARVSRGAHGFVVFQNGEAVCPDYNAEALGGMDGNPGEHCSPAAEFLGTMASVNMHWRTVPAGWVNEVLPCARHTGPCLSICRRNHTPNLPEDFKVRARRAWI